MGGYGYTVLRKGVKFPDIRYTTYYLLLITYNSFYIFAPLVLANT